MSAIYANFPPFSGEWLTPDAAVSEYGLPLEIIDAAILDGRLTVRVVCGARVVRRSEVQAYRLELMARRCAGCED